MLVERKSIALDQGTGAPAGPVSSYNLFQEPWWLNAMAAGEWDEVTVKRGEKVVARLPFVKRKELGTTWLLQPKLTPYLGPWLHASEAKLTNRIAEEKELMQELIEKLPKFDIFRQCFAPEVTYWLPFYWRGFSQTTRYTYRIPDLTDLAGLWAGLRENIRREIRKAQKSIVVRSNLDIDSFARVWALTFARQGMRLPVGTELLHRLDNACEERGCRRMFFAEDAQGKIHAVAYVVWNADCTYYLMGGCDPERRNIGAGSLVLWESLAFASTVSREFDFEGSMIEPVERFFRAFGAEPISFSSVTKLSRRLGVLTGLYRGGSALLGRTPVI